MLRADPGSLRLRQLRQRHAGREVEARLAATRWAVEARGKSDAGGRGGHGGRGEALRRETSGELEKRNEPK